jgi:cytochrome P450
MLRSRVRQEKEAARVVVADEDDDNSSSSSRPAMLHELLQGPLPKAEKEPNRVVDECQSVVGAGSITTGEMLSAASYHLIADPNLLRKLKDELSPLGRNILAARADPAYESSNNSPI